MVSVEERTWKVNSRWLILSALVKDLSFVSKTERNEREAPAEPRRL